MAMDTVKLKFFLKNFLCVTVGVGVCFNGYLIKFKTNSFFSEGVSKYTKSLIKNIS